MADQAHHMVPPPMWAYLCGVIASGTPIGTQWPFVILGVLLTGPIVCGMSQAANDWCDRHVDAINEPNRPIPSGRISDRWGLWTALTMPVLSLFVGWQLGPWGFTATVLGILAAWAYSAEPVRIKKSGWWGPGPRGLAYETLPWVTGAAVLSAGAPSSATIAIAVLYGLGAHGIMTLNDFKALEGDAKMSVYSLPATLGPERAARVAFLGMAVPQLVVIALLFSWGKPLHACAVGALVLGQVAAMRVLLRDPKAKAPWYNGAGVTHYVAGMMISACGSAVALATARRLRTGLAADLKIARKVFMREHGQVFRVLGAMQDAYYKSDKRRERFVSLCHDVDVQTLTFEAYMNKKLVKARPMAHLKIGIKNLAHLTGLVSETRT